MIKVINFELYDHKYFIFKILRNVYTMKGPSLSTSTSVTKELVENLLEDLCKVVIDKNISGMHSLNLWCTIFGVATLEKTLILTSYSHYFITIFSGNYNNYIFVTVLYASRALKLCLHSWYYQLSSQRGNVIRSWRKILNFDTD